MYKQDGGWHAQLFTAAGTPARYKTRAVKRAISLNYFNDVCSPALVDCNSVTLSAVAPAGPCQICVGRAGFIHDFAN